MLHVSLILIGHHQALNTCLKQEYTVYCIQYTVYSTLYTVYSIHYTVYCILYTVHCIQYTVYGREGLEFAG